MSGYLNLPHFDHKNNFSDQKSQLCHLKSDLCEKFSKYSFDSKDCHWLVFQSQLDHLIANFERKEEFC